MSIDRDRLLMMTASGIVRDIRPPCLNAAETLGRISEALASRDAEIERLAERCEAYKGQVEAGSHEIARLRTALIPIVQLNEERGSSIPVDMIERAFAALNQQPASSSLASSTKERP